MTDLVMTIKVKNKVVFEYTQHPGDFDLQDVFITLKEEERGKKDKILGIK